MSSALDFEGTRGEGLPDDSRFGARLINVVGDWFLEHILGNPESFWLAIRGLGEDPAEADRLCKDITSAPYIDYMRPKVDEDRFRDIEEAAGVALRADEFDPVAQFPHTIILMLGLGRTYLNQNTLLYELGRKSYEYYKGLALGARGDSGETAERYRSIALETGIQLYRRKSNSESNEEIWDYLQLEFKFADSLPERRMQFHLTEDPTELYERTKNRWLNYGETVDRALPREEEKLYGALSPQMLDLPIPYDSTDALHIVESFSKALRDLRDETDPADLSDKRENLRKKQNEEELARNLRILQWDIFTRDLLAEQTAGRLSYQSSLGDRGLQGFPPDDFLEQLALESWEAHCNHIPLHSGVLRKRYPREEHVCPVAESLPQHLRKYRGGFNRLLNEANKYNPTSFDDTTAAFADRQNKKVISKALIVEDGELTFFILLWLLRQSVSLGEEPGAWLEDPWAKLSVGFCPSADKQWVEKEDLASFGQACGLLAPSHRGDYILTRRWRSLLRWLQRQRRAVRDSGTEDGSGINMALPVKKVVARRGKSDTPEFLFALGLEKFFRSAELKEYVVGARVFPDEITIRDFAQRHLGPLLRIADENGLLRLGVVRQTDGPAAQPDDPWPHRDIVIFRLSRAGFLPLEHLFRAYQPYELHLLILALSFTQTETNRQESAPISLGFATIAGSLPPSVACGMSVNQREVQEDAEGWEGHKRDVKKARQWLAPYWTLFTALATELSVGKLQTASKQLGVDIGVGIGIEEMLSAFSHEVGKISAHVFNRYFLKMSDVFSIQGVPPSATGYEWDEPAGTITPAAYPPGVPHDAAEDISEWQVCPTPVTLRTLRYLYSVWIGAKVTLQDLGVMPDALLEEMVHTLKPIAQEMSIARERSEQMNIVNSLTASRDAEDKTLGRAKAAGNIVTAFTPEAKRLRLAKRGTTSEDSLKKIFLARALLAALSNAVGHTYDGDVTVKARVEDDWAVIEVVNFSATDLPTSGPRTDEAAMKAYQKEVEKKKEFSLGTEAVLKACAKYLKGAARLEPFYDEHGTLYFRSTIRFPLPGPVMGEATPWITTEQQ